MYQGAKLLFLVFATQFMSVFYLFGNNEELIIISNYIQSDKMEYRFYMSNAQLAKEPKWNPDDPDAKRISLATVKGAVSRARKQLASFGISAVRPQEIMLCRVSGEVWIYAISFEDREGSGGRVPALMSGRLPIVRRSRLE